VSGSIPGPSRPSRTRRPLLPCGEAAAVYSGWYHRYLAGATSTGFNGAGSKKCTQHQRSGSRCSSGMPRRQVRWELKRSLAAPHALCLLLALAGPCLHDSPCTATHFHSCTLPLTRDSHALPRLSLASHRYRSLTPSHRACRMAARSARAWPRPPRPAGQRWRLGRAAGETRSTTVAQRS